MIEQQRSKFEYKEFNKKGHFIESPMKNLSDPNEFKKEQIIHDAAIEHFSDKLEEPSDTSMWRDIKTHKVAEDNIPDMELSNIKTHSFSEDGQKLNSDIVTENAPAPKIDIEKVKEESYQMGYKAAESLLAPKLQEKVDGDNFHKLLQEKLASTVPNSDLGAGLFEMASGLIAILAQKLHLVMPADFESIMLGEMMPIINKYYKKGKVIAKVNPEKVDYCNNLFRIGELTGALADNIELVPDESMSKNDCSIEWQDALLEYNQEDLVKEADKILDHLKMKIEN